MKKILHSIFKIEILALLVGVLGGYSAFYFKFVVETFLISDNIPPYLGLIFGLFLMPFIYFFTKSIFRTVMWLFFSYLSYLCAFLSGMYIYSNNPFKSWDSSIVDVVLQNTFIYSVAGFIGAIILILGYLIFLGDFKLKKFSFILFIGFITPLVLVYFFDTGKGSQGNIDDRLLLSIMMIWQGYMSYAFVRLLRISRQK